MLLRELVKQVNERYEGSHEWDAMRAADTAVKDFYETMEEAS